MGEAGSFPEALFAVRAGFVQLRISLVGVSLENAARVTKVVLHMLRLPVGSKAIDHTRRRRPVPRALITDITPDPAFLHSFAEPLVASRVVQHPARYIIGIANFAGQDRGREAPDPWLQGSRGPSAPVHQGTAG